jgi:hypothetical protein
MVENRPSILERIQKNERFVRLKTYLRELFRGQPSETKSASKTPEAITESAPTFNKELVLARLAELTTDKEPLSESEKTVVISNVKKLYWMYVNSEPNSDLTGLGGGDRRILPDQGESIPAIATSVTVYYDSDAGRIAQPPQEYIKGDYSRFRTETVSKNHQLVQTENGWRTDWNLHPTFTIETKYPDGTMSLPEWDMALSGGIEEAEDGSFTTNVDPAPMTDRTIRPERLDPELESNQNGEFVYHLDRLTPEDQLVLTSLLIFNQLYSK